MPSSLKHLCLRKRVGEFWNLAWFVFYARLNFRVRRNIAPVPSFVYNSRKNILPKFDFLKIPWNIVSRKRAKQFQRRSSGWMRLKQQGVRIITCGLQTNASTYFITIARKCWPDKLSNTVPHGNLTLHFSSTRHRCCSLEMPKETKNGKRVTG